ncbi:hypothetical protein ACMGE6_02150 [Macrococcus equi]|uniref:hypothetical protein n=1 Tax=Macrococcus equi TaxID=3395462 RepID=UPI0039BE1186
MKKLLLSTITAGLLVSNFNSADAVNLKPSDLKIGINTYEAVLTKSTKALLGNGSSDNMITLQKGKKVTVVERKQLHGYDYLVLKGNYVIPLNDSGIKIIKPLPGKTNYSKFVLSKDAKQKIANAPKSSVYYDDYKRYVIRYDKFLFTAFQLSYSEITLQQQFHMKPEERGGLGGWAEPTKTFSEWMKNKDYSSHKPRNQFKCYASDPGTTVNILSKAFIDGYFYNNNRSYGKFIVGKSIPENSFGCSMSASDEGVLSRFKDISVKLTSRFNPKIKSVYITPIKNYSYAQIIQAYGQPSSTRFIANGRVEHQLIYDYNKHNGYKIIVALNNYKGNVKYLRKMNE